LSGREIAGVLGVTNATVSRDLSPVTNVTEDESKSMKTLDKETLPVTNVTPPRTIDIRRCDYRELLGSVTDVDAIITNEQCRTISHNAHE
jgi:hypothetical protein